MDSNTPLVLNPKPPTIWTWRHLFVIPLFLVFYCFVFVVAVDVWHYYMPNREPQSWCIGGMSYVEFQQSLTQVMDPLGAPASCQESE